LWKSSAVGSLKIFAKLGNLRLGESRRKFLWVKTPAERPHCGSFWIKFTSLQKKIVLRKSFVCLMCVHVSLVSFVILFHVAFDIPYLWFRYAFWNWSQFVMLESLLDNAIFPLSLSIQKNALFTFSFFLCKIKNHNESGKLNDKARKFILLNWREKNLFHQIKIFKEIFNEIFNKTLLTNWIFNW
jgi:hypothetical protein